MTPADPFERIEGDLDYDRLPAQAVTVPLGEDRRAAGEPGELLFVLYVGLLDMLAEATVKQLGEEQAAARLATVLSKFEAIEPTLRFWLFERRGSTEEHEMLARMRGKDIAVTREWLIPRLNQDIEAYQARIGALRRVLEEPEAGGR